MIYRHVIALQGNTCIPLTILHVFICMLNVPQLIYLIERVVPSIETVYVYLYAF